MTNKDVNSCAHDESVCARLRRRNQAQTNTPAKLKKNDQMNIILIWAEQIASDAGRQHLAPADRFVRFMHRRGPLWALVSVCAALRCASVWRSGRSCGISNMRQAVSLLIIVPPSLPAKAPLSLLIPQLCSGVWRFLCCKAPGLGIRCNSSVTCTRIGTPCPFCLCC